VSQQNVNDWTDKFGNRLEIGQRIAAAWGSELYVGRIVWFTKGGVTIESEDKDGNVKKMSIGYKWNSSYKLGADRIFIIEY